ncbi:MAG TPA: YfiR family protein [Pedobacter sp.]
MTLNRELIKLLYLSRLRGYATVSLFFLFFTANGNTQPRPTSEYQLKAAFIYNFTRFIDWPPASFGSTDSPFVIGILGDDGISAYINELVKGEKLGNRQIVVRRFSNPAEITQCQILFIGGKDVPEMKGLLNAMNRRGVLTVSDAPDFAKLGGIVRFYKEANKLRLQINVDEVKISELTISSKLLSLSNVYKAN